LPKTNRGSKKSRGASLVEFGILVGLVAVVAISSVAVVGNKVSEIFGGSGNALSLGMNGMIPTGGVSLAGGVSGAPEPPILTNQGQIAFVRPGMAA
jgi:Flp pilus assembly pilin Flp